jgi:hypothetical protein
MGNKKSPRTRTAKASLNDQELPPEAFRELLDPELRQAFNLNADGHWCLCCGYICETVRLRRSSAEDYNRRYQETKADCEKALAERDFVQFVFFHEGPHQVEALKGLMPRLTEAQYGRLVRRVWTESNDVIWTSISEWADLFLSLSNASCRHFMTRKDQKAFDALPEEFIVYRGYYPGLNEGGISWSPNREIAEGFGVDGKTVRCKTISKSQVLGYTNVRGEQEVIFVEGRRDAGA